MKKILLTGVAAACLSFAAVAQQRDSTQTQSNQYQQSDQQQNRTATDTASTQYRQGDQQQGNQYQQQQSDQNQQQPGNQFNQNADQSRDSLNQNDMERPGNNQTQPNNGQSQDLQPGVSPNDNMNNQNDNMNSQPGTQQGDKTMDQMNGQSRSSLQGQANAAPDVEVVKDKEGPDNQVVYQYQGDLYYVDRDKKELVKAKESDLQDAKHNVIVEEGTANADNDTNTNSGRSNRQ